MLYTTLNKIIELKPCENDWKQLSTYLNKNKADDESLDFKTILEFVGIKDTLWYLQTQEFKDYYKFVTRVAYSVLPIYEKKYPDDKRPRLAIEDVDKFMEGKISKEELKTVMYASFSADRTADAAWSAARAANIALAADALSADRTADAALAASRAASFAAVYPAWAVAWAAARAANVALAAAAYPASAVAWAADAWAANRAADAVLAAAWADNVALAADAWAADMAVDAVFAADMAAAYPSWALAYDRKEKWKEIEKIFVEECCT